MNDDEVIYLGKLFEELDINELNNVHDLGIGEGESLESYIFRRYPSRQHAPIRRILDVMVHVSQCRTPRCKYPYCNNLKARYRHYDLCKTRVAGGCLLCKKMLCMLHMHAKACKESKCAVALCSFAKENIQQGIGDFCETPAFPTLEMLKRALAVVVHTVECRVMCQDPDCHMVKEIFDHTSFCKIRITGGCGTCRQAWVVVYQHTKVCKESNCKVPRCRDLKEHLLQKSMRRRMNAVP